MSKECLDTIFNEILKQKAKRIHYWRGKKRTKLTTSHSMYIKKKYDMCKLTTREQFLFTLIRLRRNVSIEMLSGIFGISNGTGSRIFVTWILFMSKELKCFVPFSTLNDLQGIEFPTALRGIKNLRAIIDCTEFYVEKPSRPHCQRTTYSQYKSTNTFKLLISMSPLPHLNFVSRLFTGSISDKEIVKESGFLDHLEAGDVVMADKGFNIQDLLALKEAKLLAPPLLRKGNVSAVTSTQTRRVATIRVHIERMIRKLKCFTILKGAFPLTMKPHVNSIIAVCAALVNLQPSCINKEEEYCRLEL
ncbi:uncharacterized protein LOC114541973 [Dendronephthya gigantea]|uniref:uncharacterized protein LOC114517645 n=1 Tax=Dendronephthya gigantea TaxID=151771 RepID=UPI00106C1765|nr:uncharacterized protein LOC114517645 [Dendronephthya gigantea]XP_028410220.1 uncharacterized protein LOC114532825 [Dendronephthya gigantea]XP_028416822.1 uncharacterized protein LOC114541029 [Dendronephthya gigantea]XP_028417559.1 uncharacterized protein LOC114541973 [Dendronephthya gigantea]